MNVYILFEKVGDLQLSQRESSSSQLFLNVFPSITSFNTQNVMETRLAKRY